MSEQQMRPNQVLAAVTHPDDIEFMMVGMLLLLKQEGKEWFDISQRMDVYLTEMETLSRDVGKLSGCFTYAEGWRQHSHLGFGPVNFNPFCMRLSALMIAKRIPDASIPMSMLADHPNVHFNYRGGLGVVSVEMY